jgi:hypothetical protein
MKQLTENNIVRLPELKHRSSQVLPQTHRVESLDSQLVLNCYVPTYFNTVVHYSSPGY